MLKPLRKHTDQPKAPAKAKATPKPKGRRSHPEAALQATIVKLLRAVGEWVVFVENESQRSPQQAARWLAMGGSPGFPDVFLPMRRIAIECKAPERRGEKDGGCTREQLNAHEALRRGGWLVVVAYATEDVPGWLLNGEENPAQARHRLDIGYAIEDIPAGAQAEVDAASGQVRRQRLGKGIKQVQAEQRRPWREQCDSCGYIGECRCIIEP